MTEYTRLTFITSGDLNAGFFSVSARNSAGFSGLRSLCIFLNMIQIPVKINNMLLNVFSKSVIIDSKVGGYYSVILLYRIKRFDVMIILLCDR